MDWNAVRRCDGDVNQPYVVHAIWKSKCCDWGLPRILGVDVSTSWWGAKDRGVAVILRMYVVNVIYCLL